MESSSVEARPSLVIAQVRVEAVDSPASAADHATNQPQTTWRTAGGGARIRGPVTEVIVEAAFVMFGGKASQRWVLGLGGTPITRSISGRADPGTDAGTTRGLGSRRST